MPADFQVLGSRFHVSGSELQVGAGIVKKSEAKPPRGYRERSEMQSVPNNEHLELGTWNSVSG